MKKLGIKKDPEIIYIYSNRDKYIRLLERYFYGLCFLVTIVSAVMVAFPPK